jgi:hypothetical protein
LILGPLFGALAATFIPIAWGINVFFWVAGAVFLVTVLANTLFHSRGRPFSTVLPVPIGNKYMHSQYKFWCSTNVV